MTNSLSMSGAFATAELAAGLEKKDNKSIDSPESIKKAASQFEALLIGEMLKSSRESGGDGGWFGAGDEADSGLGDLAEQQLAQSIADHGGFGLAKSIGLGLSKSVQSAASAKGGTQK